MSSVPELISFCKALRLHLLGEECEEQGNLQQGTVGTVRTFIRFGCVSSLLVATAFYRLAAKMVPDIEFKAFEVNKQGRQLSMHGHTTRACDCSSHVA